MHTNTAQADRVTPAVRDGGVSYRCGTGEGGHVWVDLGDMFRENNFELHNEKPKLATIERDCVKRTAAAEPPSLRRDEGSHSLDQSIQQH